MIQGDLWTSCNSDCGPRIVVIVIDVNLCVYLHVMAEQRSINLHEEKQ